MGGHLHSEHSSASMAPRMILIILMVLCGIQAKYSVVVPIDEWFYTRSGIPAGTGFIAAPAIQWGAADTWKYDFADKNFDFEIEFELFDDEATPAKGVENVIHWNEKGYTLAVGNPLSEVSVSSGQAATTYGVAQVSSLTSSNLISNDLLYPYFSRLSPNSDEVTEAMTQMILQMIETQGDGWRRIAILATSDAYGVSLAESMIKQAKGTAIEVATYQTFLAEEGQVEVPMQEVVHSDARVIITFAISGFSAVLEEADAQGLIDDYHAFLAGPSMLSNPFAFLHPNGTVNPVMVDLLRGHIGATPKIYREGERYERLLEHWINSDPADDPSWGPGKEPSSLGELNYDIGVLVAYAAVEAERQGLLSEFRRPTAVEWTTILRNVSFEGSSGPLALNSVGDREMPFTLVNWDAKNLRWRGFGEYSRDEGITLFPGEAIVWHDNTTNYPDLERGPAYRYWSCSKGEMGYDETGHTVKRQTPDAGGFDDIDSSFFCDHFIDCPNLSDETNGCGANYTALFIAFGVLTGVLILICLGLLVFVVVFGFIVPRRRVRASSPTFLIIILVSCILGYISEYSWYGRPHPVACGFRPWLLGLAVVSLVSALSAKTWRLWRVFKIAYKKERITDLQLLILYCIMVIPAVVILIVWTIVSTPTAEMKEGYDGRDHYVCNTGGFTGEPGGLIFFIIFITYEALVLLVAAGLCIVTRNVPSFFNESKLIAISIYNLGFLAAVCIPVIIVLEEINPFASWIIRAVAVLYAFTATLVLQFAPKVIGVLFVDRGGDTALPKLGKVQSSSSSSEYSSQPSTGADV